MYKVLLVDDERFILEGLKQIIKWEEHGLEIVGEASDGLQALKRIEELNVNILITDLKMPFMDGLELIRQLRLTNKNIRVIILSGFDDFLFVREAAKMGIENYLLKPVNQEELSLTLQNTVEHINLELHKKIKQRKDESIIKENILYRWVTNKISSSELAERSSLLGIQQNLNYFKVCLIRLNDPANKNLVVIDNLIKFAAINICTENLGIYCDGFVFSDMDDDIIILISDKRENLINFDSQKLLDRCRSNIFQRLKINVFITIGDNYYQSSDVYKSYLNAKATMNYSLILPKNTIVDYQITQKELSLRQNIISIDYNQLNLWITKMDKNKTKEIIDEIFIKMIAFKGIAPSFIQNTVMEILFNIYKCVNDHQNKTTNGFVSQENLFASLSQMKNAGEIKDWICNLAEKAIDSLISIENNFNPVIMRVIDFINNNFSSDISIKSLSVSFKINASYLGQMFKNETGEMFSNYLHKIRIEKAKELLTHTDLTSIEIAEKVGYANASYFITIFKKLTGQYPTKYKRS